MELKLGDGKGIPMGRKYFRIEISEIGESSNSAPAYIELWASDIKEALGAAAGFIPSGCQPVKLHPGTSIGFRVKGTRIVNFKNKANPTAVGEGLPKVTDCDDQGRCWLASDNVDVTMGTGWVLENPEKCTNWSHWLPYWAIPNLEGYTSSPTP